MATEITQYLKSLRKQNYQLTVLGSGHVRICAPDGHQVTTASSTTRYPRSLKNLKAIVQRDAREHPQGGIRDRAQAQ